MKIIGIKKILVLCMLCVCIYSVNAQIKVPTTLITGTSTPSVYANEGKGGHHQVADTVERNAISKKMRQWGMFCAVENNGNSIVATYQLVRDNTNTVVDIEDNSQWLEFSGGGGVWSEESSIVSTSATGIKLAAGTIGYVLTSDDSGIGTWKPIAEEETISIGGGRVLVPSANFTGMLGGEAQTSLKTALDELTVKEFLEKVFFPPIATAPPTITTFTGGATIPYVTWKDWGFSSSSPSPYTLNWTIQNESKDGTEAYTDDSDFDYIGLYRTTQIAAEEQSITDLTSANATATPSGTFDVTLTTPATYNASRTETFQLDISDEAGNDVSSDTQSFIMSAAQLLTFTSSVTTPVAFSRNSRTVSVSWDIDDKEDVVANIKVNGTELNVTTLISSSNVTFPAPELEETGLQYKPTIDVKSTLSNAYVGTQTKTISMTDPTALSFSAPTLKLDGGDAMPASNWFEYSNTGETLELHWGAITLNHENLLSVTAGGQAQTVVITAGMQTITFGGGETAATRFSLVVDGDWYASQTEYTPYVYRKHKVFKGTITDKPQDIIPGGVSEKTLEEWSTIIQGLQTQELGGNYINDDFTFDINGGAYPSGYIIFAIPSTFTVTDILFYNNLGKVFESLDTDKGFYNIMFKNANGHEALYTICYSKKPYGATAMPRLKLIP